MEMSRERQLQEIIKSDEIICSISCRYADLKIKLEEKGKTYLLSLLKDSGCDATEPYYSLEKYDKTFAQIGKSILESEPMCNSRALYRISNDCRPYELWLESLEDLLKVYSDIQPIKIKEVKNEDSKTLFWGPETQDLLSMSMNGRLYNMLRVYRTSILTDMFNSQGRCVMSEFVSIINQQKEEEKQAKKEWKDV